MTQQTGTAQAGTHQLPPLPYALDALEPCIDAKTMEIHHGKHHAGYVNNLNKALEGHANLQKLSVEELLPSWTRYRKTSGSRSATMQVATPIIHCSGKL